MLSLAVTCRIPTYLDARARRLKLPQGLGARHMAAAAISKATPAVGIVVSQTATVRVFKTGKLVAEILPELWLLGPIHQLSAGPDSHRQAKQHDGSGKGGQCHLNH